jgi:hypothetical protein
VPDQHEHLELPGQGESLPAGRHFLQRTLAHWGLAQLSDEAALAPERDIQLVAAVQVRATIQHPTSRR